MALVFESPIFTASIYRHALAIQKDDGSVIFLLPERLPFEDRDDTISHIGNGEEYLWDLALRYYPDRPNSWDLWDVIMQFQTEPIQDASIPVPKGREILIPSDEYLEEVVSGQPLSEVPEI